ncbi:hypothetical protein Asphe3_41420 (plasmid) [Pseudarthrobacter phenanthrenivorans Sphe3]|uniref:YaaC-like Protein n=1 Tax=Pseudarthrobacter phenanthrenivorans (strain DSM 18606 / JCM 16027 / LMG 23796 / Sphe3) TaxID=930171 RepID=F0MCF6_PSEPM|nr:hypothetical protein [Pseudarthrobacter phenanthrenivorans]ADX75207.1 hypothetical protein Asphe3_41420 [Pseudarthrobacter phenanthrenivorans Sphe3]
MTTHADLQAVPIKQIWQQLRALRSQRVGRAARGDRQKTFNAALEQAEQLFSAGSTVGTATQPILLFYGLSQLGRAIAATSTELDNNEYRLSGHGISDQLNGAATQGLARVPVRGEGKGAFPVVAKALKASPMSQEVALGDLWGLLPDAERFPLPGNSRLQRLILDQESPHIIRVSDLARGQLYPLPIDLQVSVKDPSIGRDVIPEAEITEEHHLLRKHLEPYPSLAGWRLPDPTGRIPYQRGYYDSETWLHAPVAFPKSSSESEKSALEGRATEYHGVLSVYPSLDDSNLPAHPFMLWWAVLFTLSRLARYEPSVWLKLTSVAEDPSAVPIEYILNEAIRAVPELALNAILCVSGQGG